MLDNKQNDDIGDLEDMPLTFSYKNEFLREEFEIGKSVNKYRFLNSLSLIILLLSIFSIFYYSSNSLIAYHEFFNPKKIHFQIDLFIFIIIWGIIISTKFF